MPINEQRIFWNCNSSDPKDHEILARCVQEGLHEIEVSVKEAEEVLKANTGDRSFDGYDQAPKRPERVREQVRALFEYLQSGKPKIGTEFSYSLEPWDSTQTRQRIRLIREVLHYGRATCIEWVQLLASCLANVNLNPLIIVTEAPPERHAILGYWLEDQRLPKPVMTGDEFVQYLQTKRYRFGVVNATRIPPDENGQRKPFDGREGAEWEAITHLPKSARPFVIDPVPQVKPAAPAQKILWVVDIRAARAEGIKPLLPLEPWSGNHSLPPAEHFQWRPELEKIKEWWRDDNSYGVLALVGIGGAGKTALVHHFLAQLPGSEIQEKGVKKDETLPIPDALFVWSFYEQPDVDRCATELYNHLTNEKATKATFEQVQEVLSNNYRGCRVLLIFDGLEKLQIAPGIEPEEEGGTFGQFRPEGAPLARFLSWCCDGPRPVHLLITSRFGLTDLRRYWAAGGYRTVDLEDLPLESARALLRAAGVEGSDSQLDALIQGFGNHAQTLDLLGNALRIWCDGDPSRVSELPSLGDVKKLAGIRDKVWGRTRILRFYEKRLPSDTLNVLQLMTLFADLPVDKRIRLAAAVLRQSPSTLHRHIRALSHEYKLLPMTKPAERYEWEIHPALKDYFYFSLNPNARMAYHQQLADLLSRMATSGRFIRPRKWGDLLVLYELVHQLVAAGRIQEAFNIYRENMGAYDHMAQLDAFTVGLRTVREILDSPYVETLFPWQRARLLNDAGGFLRALGALEEGLRHYREALHVLQCVLESEERAKEDIRFNRSVALRNTARILVLLGRLRQAQAEAERAYAHEQSVGDNEGIQIALCMAAYAIGLQGDVGKAFKLYKRARTKGKSEEMFKKEYVFHWAHLMLLAGMNREALDHVRQIAATRPPTYVRHFCELIAVMATARTLGGDLEQGLSRLAEIERWATSVGRKELEIRAQLAKVELALRRLELAKCGEALKRGIPLVERNGYGLLWIDLQVVKGQWELACGRQLHAGKELPPELAIWTPQQWFELAEASALRALNGQLKDSDKPAPQPDLPEDQLAMLGARHPECGYAWGEGDALYLLGETMLTLAQCVGSHGHDSKGRSHKELIEGACQAAEEALALRKRIQDPKVKDTQDQLRKIEEVQGGGGS